MLFNFEPVNLLILCLIAANLIGILAYAVFKNKTRHERKNSAAITAALIDYFQRTGVKVTVNCAALPGQKSFTAVIESEPMKRFRLSHIIEAALREHVYKACNLDLEKVYWRFPVSVAVQEVARAAGEVETDRELVEADRAPPEKTDEYINEGLEYYKYIPKVEVTELPWEKFEEASTIEPKSEERP